MGSNLPAMAKPYRLVIADDHELVRRGVAQLLQAEPDLEIVGEADSVAGAIARVAELTPDVVILDVHLPDGSGVEACREITRQHPKTRVVMLSAFADEQAFVAAVLAGASGYLLKRIDASEIVASVRRVAVGETLLDEEFTERLLAKSRDADLGDPLLARLSPQELRVLDLIAEGHTNREIGEQLYLAEKTVKNYVSNLLSKLEMSNRSEAAAYAARLETMRQPEAESGGD